VEQQTHFFFAMGIPDETKLILKKHIEELNRNFPFSRWVHHEDLHITLAFLGFAPPEQLKRSTSYVMEAIKGIKPFPLAINRLGYFGNVESPRVFWAGTQESEELQLLRKKVFTACEQVGFTLETRPFRPHITLARKWSGNGAFQKEMLDIWNNIQREPLVFEVNKVVLYQTHLQKTPKYEVKAEFLLEK
jgi:2'-5' RNA ligase